MADQYSDIGFFDLKGARDLARSRSARPLYTRAAFAALSPSECLAAICLIIILGGLLVGLPLFTANGVLHQ